MITLEYLNRLKHIANGYQDGDGEGVLIEMLEALIPALPPMVAAIVQEMLRSVSEE